MKSQSGPANVGREQVGLEVVIGVTTARVLRRGPVVEDLW